MINLNIFKETVWNYYYQNSRPMPWRDAPSSYWVFISEIMLQQTQVPRVLEKFPPFVETFPDFQSLASASLKDVLQMWQGLGYNRRAKFLHQSAIRIMEDFGGKLPEIPEKLETLPGIGPATARSMCAFAFNKAFPFIETNIRSVYIHHFFNTRGDITDKELLPLIEKTLDHENPREWYYALMDYGVMLKKQYPNPSRRSAHHAKQSKFENSNRQVRGRILKTLTEHPRMSLTELIQKTEFPKDRVVYNLKSLEDEGFVAAEPEEIYSIKG